MRVFLAISKKLYSSHAPRDVFIISATRTPVGSFKGGLSSVNAITLGSIAVKEVVKRSGLKGDEVDEVIMGNVLSANLGQAPARQVCLEAGLSNSAICTTVNKVCASGMKAVTMGAQSIALHQADVIVAGGMESMSNVPFYLDKARIGYGYGHQQVIDGILKDGLWDTKYHLHMGECADETAVNYNISRSAQDEYAISSYKRSAEYTNNGFFKPEIVPVPIKSKKEEVLISEDEEYKKIDFSKVALLKPAFKKDGTVTAANASTLNDGASALLLAEESFALKKGLCPIAKIICKILAYLAYADAECDPKLFTIAPSLAVPKALKRAGLSINDISLFEINEAFSVVALILGLDLSKLNVAGGGVSLGHPIGSSGSRIVVTLINLLKSGELGCASICNGGGGATAIIIQKL